MRVDLNVPMDGGRVTDDTRIRAAAPTVLELADKGAKVLLLAHFGRPKGQRSSTQSLSMVIDAVQDVLGKEVMFVPEVAGPIVAQTIGILRDGDIALLENTRFWPGEEKNDPDFAKAIAANGDLYVNDAFSAAHRAHASTEGIAHFLPSYAGRAMQAELDALEKALGNPEKPVAAVVGGAKVSSKLDVLDPSGRQGRSSDHRRRHGQHLSRRARRRCRQVAVRARSGRRRRNRSWMRRTRPDAPSICPMTSWWQRNSPPTRPRFAPAMCMRLAADEMILDIGPQAVEALADVLKTCRTLVWNGPLGAFETPPFDAATVALAKTAAALTKEGSLVSVAGGGDTVAALNHAGVAEDFSLRLDRWRRLPRMDGRQGTAGRRSARSLDRTTRKRQDEAMIEQDMLDRITTGKGFIAALDQSGGSTPKALKGYGIEEGAWGSEEEMFGLIHQMRVRIITSPAFTGEKVLGAILFERTMDGMAEGKPVPTLLRERGVVPFIKVDKGLEDEVDGAQLMKPMPGLNELLARSKALGVVGTKMRSVIQAANPAGIAANVAQQFEFGNAIISAGLMPMLEPEYNIKSADRAEGEQILLAELLKGLDALPADRKVMLKLSIPVVANTYKPLIDHPAVARVVALSGGFERTEACAELAKNQGMIASFSRALLEDLRAQMTSDEFDASLASAIDQIYQASTDKVAA